jgi:hypothetical protein
MNTYLVISVLLSINYLLPLVAWFNMDSVGGDPEVIAGLLALYHACGGSVHGHVPAEAFRRRLRKEYQTVCGFYAEKVEKAGPHRRSQGSAGVVLGQHERRGVAQIARTAEVNGRAQLY